MIWHPWKIVHRCTVNKIAHPPSSTPIPDLYLKLYFLQLGLIQDFNSLILMNRTGEFYLVLDFSLDKSYLHEIFGTVQ